MVQKKPLASLDGFVHRDVNAFTAVHHARGHEVDREPDLSQDAGRVVRRDGGRGEKRDLIRDIRRVHGPQDVLVNEKTDQAVILANVEAHRVEGVHATDKELLNHG